MCDCDCELPKTERWARVRAEALREAADAVLAEIKVLGIPADGGARHYRAVAAMLRERAGVTAIYPPHHGWFAQMTDADGEWISYAPVHVRDRAVERVRLNRWQHRDRTHRLVRETTTYEEDPVE